MTVAAALVAGGAAAVAAGVGLLLGLGPALIVAGAAAAACGLVFDFDRGRK